ncbi:hypothetical protein, partial [Vibrio cincinnatiensis]|uniref:hypothetical protein n=1 Tax=Vibrio cincinnatiensis TaxID=675 RepID=UPI001FAA8F1D
QQVKEWKGKRREGKKEKRKWKERNSKREEKEKKKKKNNTTRCAISGSVTLTRGSRFASPRFYAPVQIQATLVPRL